MMRSEVSVVSPQEAQQKMQDGALLLDVREYVEWAQSHVPGAKLVPLAQVKNGASCAEGYEVLVLCRSGKRATQAAQMLAQSGAKPYVIEGGLEAWRAAGLPTQRAERGPIALERQVRIGAGALVLLGLLVPRLRPLSYFVSCGLIFSGVTDWCGMGILLSKMPWNRAR